MPLVVQINLLGSGSGFYTKNTSYTTWVLLESGLGGAESEAENTFGNTTEQGGEIHRRRLSEIICLSGIYLGSQYKNNADDRDFFNYFYNNSDHSIADTSKAGANTKPSGQHQLDWFRKGVDSGGRPSACNTWAAPASEVS
ncbi:hypothetical protein [Segniliparus rotundus]|uniref:hypothetical protein n=1 Tax=Segniliparus rotundus TaxID=286802 RepID=UPI0011D11F1A|nr:hypothetical protein [Segniliparus rotundus]